MDTSTWSWAWTSFLDIIVSLFSSAIGILGVAVATILVLIYLNAIMRLIVRPLIGMQLYGGMSDDIRKARSVARERQENKPKYGV